MQRPSNTSSDAPEATAGSESSTAPLALSERFTVDLRRDAGQDFYNEKDPLSLVSKDIIEFVKRRAGKRILDLGCGTGGYSKLLRELGFEVTAADRNPRYVETARSLGVTAVQVQGDALPFPDEAFDTVIMVEVLEHLPDAIVPGVLGEARRVARNLLITVPNCTQADLLIRQGMMYEHALTVDHVQFFTEESLTRLLKMYFSSVEVSQCGAIFPHRLLPAILSKPAALLYKVGILSPTIFGQLRAEVSK